MMEFLLLLLHTFSTLFMVGLIWFVQVVHYPLFLRVGEEYFAEYERAHQLRTSFVVIPVMLTELFSALLLLVMTDGNRLLLIVGLLLLGIIWLSTFFIQMPCHAALEKGYDEQAIQRLVRSNWIRVFCWSARGALVIYLYASPS